MIFHPGAAGRARKEREAAEEAARRRLLMRRLDERIDGLHAQRAANAGRMRRDDRRRWPRTPDFKVAAAILDTGAEVTCKVVDVSFGGMRVEFLDDSARPAEFGLTVPTLRFIGVVQNAWSKGAETGVEVLRWRESA